MPCKLHDVIEQFTEVSMNNGEEMAFNFVDCDMERTVQEIDALLNQNDLTQDKAQKVLKKSD